MVTNGTLSTFSRAFDMYLLNGVSLVTKAGQPKSRFSDEEKLQICGATQQDLREFIELFAPRLPFYAVTRSKSHDPRDWTTPRGRLTERVVLEHLLGGAIPGRSPRWVAPRSWETACWVGLDVDYRGDQGDFKNRCGQIRKALRILRIPKKGILTQATPSGGRHYRFFLTRHVRVQDISYVLGLIGIHHQPGKIEIFPSKTQGMRLPFGAMPNRQAAPQR